MTNTFDTLVTLDVDGQEYRIHDLNRLDPGFEVQKLPYSFKILLENLLRAEDGISVRATDIELLADWKPGSVEGEISFSPARVLMQDFTGVPAVVDLAAMREAMQSLGGEPAKINPLSPADLVIDHSVMVDFFGMSEI